MTLKENGSVVDTLLSIGDLADELQVSTRTIRYYEERGLILPRRTDGGQRIYGRRERGRLKLILRGKAAGFDLEEIRDVLSLYDQLPSDEAEAAQAVRIVDMIDRRLIDLDQRIGELEAMRRTLKEHRGMWEEKIGN